MFVTTEDEEELYLRFYDPFVSDIFLPNCNADQLREFFGPINFIIIETETPNQFKQFCHEDGILKVNEFEYIFEPDDKLDERLAHVIKNIDEQKELEDREEVERINKQYNGDNPVIVN